MFDYLSGSVESLGQNLCVIDTHGIGWSLIISTKCAGKLSGKKEAKVYTYLNMGSSDRAVMELFGFSCPQERETFLLLIGISGIGPKAAISILSALAPEELAMCVLSGDAKSITAAQGIGMKGAQKIILELTATNKEIAVIRKEINLCDDIAVRSGIMRDKLKKIREYQPKENEQRKEKSRNDKLR